MIEVVGEAGIGKSRLLHELRERVLARNVTTLKGRCRAFGDVAPYCPSSRSSEAFFASLFGA
jgi:predicted ATPase